VPILGDVFRIFRYLPSTLTIAAGCINTVRKGRDATYITVKNAVGLDAAACNGLGISNVSQEYSASMFRVED
jgi:hypothetical protein